MNSTNRRSARRNKSAMAPHPPASPAQPETRMTELIGLDEDGNMSLWAVGEVRPVSRFEGNGPWIDGGYYVVQWKGHAITVHCGNVTGRLVSVLFMCSRNMQIFLPRAEVEAMLLGKVIPDTAQQAATTAAFDCLLAARHARGQAPHRRRGHM